MLFNVMDTNKDGKLSMAELRDSAEVTGVAWDDETWKAKLVKAGLSENTPYVDFKTFTKILTTNMCRFSVFRDESSKSALRKMFDVFDKDHDGLATLEDIKGTIMSTGVVMTDDMLSSVVGKEAINFEEFCELLTNSLGKRTLF